MRGKERRGAPWTTAARRARVGKRAEPQEKRAEPQDKRLEEKAAARLAVPAGKPAERAAGRREDAQRAGPVRRAQVVTPAARGAAARSAVTRRAACRERAVATPCAGSSSAGSRAAVSIAEVSTPSATRS